MMDQEATIQIEKVYPRNGTKPASIKDTQGHYFGIPDGAVGMLQPGMQGTVTYWVKQGENRQFLNATKWNGQDLPKGQAAPPAQPLLTPQQPLHPNAVVHPAAPPPNVTASPPNDQAEAIFVTGIVGRSMQSGKFDKTDIDALTKEAVAAWRNRNSGTVVLRTEGGMPDDAPLPAGPDDYGYRATG